QSIGSWIEIPELIILLLRHREVFIADAVVQGEAGPQLPCVLNKSGRRIGTEISGIATGLANRVIERGTQECRAARDACFKIIGELANVVCYYISARDTAIGKEILDISVLNAELESMFLGSDR